jgi:2-C-methyl-D-erythritol 4-phosphate cytidylyltransferase
MLKKYAIIVAGGSGSRMKTELPKQFLEINGKPILMHTIEKFAMNSIELILVLNVDFHEYWNNLCIQHSFTIPHTLVKGGNTRYQSVKNGLAFIKEKSLVAIHDAVRPLIKQETILEAFTQAEQRGNVILAVPSKDSIRRMQDDVSIAVPREDYYLVQTPQVFLSDILIKAYKEPFRNEFSDDASVVEFAGHKIHLMEGDSSNIKITFPDDLLIAQALLKK